MIGKIGTGGSFSKCISYCLEDKRELSEEMKKELSIKEGLQHKNRAEVLEYNQCFGDKKELTRQFQDVRKLNSRVEKPVFHITLRPAPGDELSRKQFIEIGQAAAREFGLDKNQYVCVLHRDTAQPHIHIVGNRVGFDGRLANDSYSYRRMSDLCRAMEKKYGLKQIASPRRFQTPEERLNPRRDLRKEGLKRDIQIALKDCLNYADFERKMKEGGYQVIKGRGIAFEDKKRVRTKGSQVGFSLRTIETIVEANQLNKASEKESLTPEQRVKLNTDLIKAERALERQLFLNRGMDPNGWQAQSEFHTLPTILEILLRPEGQGQQLPWELRRDQRKEQKRKHSRHL